MVLLQLQSNGQDGESGKIPSAGLVASLITTDHEFDSFIIIKLYHTHFLLNYHALIHNAHAR